jgi:hypothetical protein
MKVVMSAALQPCDLGYALRGQKGTVYDYQESPWTYVRFGGVQKSDDVI